MVSKPFLIFCLAFIATITFTEAHKFLASFKESCSITTPCSEENNFVCSRYNVCECKHDQITHVPWVFVQRLNKCISNLREDENVPADPQRQYGSNQYGGGGWGSSGSEHGSNPVGGGGWGSSGSEHGSNPVGGGGGSSSSSRCTTINGAGCYTNPQCIEKYGDLGVCELGSSSPRDNRCVCCHRSEETGFYNNRCHFVKRLGESCNYDEECKLGSSSTVCRRNRCNRQNANNYNGIGKSVYVSATLIIFGFFATKVIGSD